MVGLSQLALELVRIASPTGAEAEVANFYAKILQKYDLDVEFNYADNDRPNVIGKLKGTGDGPNLMLHGHLDTVPIGKCVEPKIMGGRIYGRGSCDMKGSLAAMVHAVRLLNKSNVRLKGDLVLVGSVDHESPTGSGKGIRNVVKLIKDRKLRIDGAVNTEGPMDGIKIAQGGCAMFTLSVTKKGGTLYAATSSLTANPIIWASELIKQLERIDKQLAKKKHPLISLRPTLQVGLVNGGDFAFSVPDCVKLEGAIRWNPDENFRKVAPRFKKSVKALQKRLRAEYDPSANIMVDIRVDRDACEVSSTEPVVTSLRGAVEEVTGRRPKLTGTRYVTDLSVLNEEARVPSVEFGPFLPNDMTAHTDHESVSVNNLEILSRVYAITAMDFCGIASKA